MDLSSDTDLGRLRRALRRALAPGSPEDHACQYFGADHDTRDDDPPGERLNGD